MVKNSQTVYFAQTCNRAEVTLPLWSLRLAPYRLLELHRQGRLTWGDAGSICNEYRGNSDNDVLVQPDESLPEKGCLLLPHESLDAITHVTIFSGCFVDSSQTVALHRQDPFKRRW